MLAQSFGELGMHHAPLADGLPGAALKQMDGFSTQNLSQLARGCSAMGIKVGWAGGIWDLGL